MTDGPFSEAKEMVGGFWIIQAKDHEEAVEWAKRVPLGGDAFVEVRQIHEMSDFPEEIQEAAQLSRGAAAPDVGVTAATQRTIEAVWRIESARLIGGLARMVRDVSLAEDLAQDALVAALEKWPRVGRPGQPGRLAHGHGQAPRDRPHAPRAGGSRPSSRSSRGSSACRWR